jgi:hypothetical protein
LGKNSLGVEYNGLLIPCAKTYKDWFFNHDGIMTGVKPGIMSGIDYQRAVREEILNNLTLTHPVGATLGRNLLQRSGNFKEVLMSTMDNIWTNYQARYSEVMPAGAFSVLCAIIGQVQREFCKVRQHGAAAIWQGSDTQRIGATCWYLLQTHCKVDGFFQAAP